MDAAEHQRAGGHAGQAQGDQPRIGFVEAESQPAAEFAENEKPGSGGDAGRAFRPVGGPDGRRDLDRERRGKKRSEAGAAQDQVGPDEHHRPRAAQDRRAQPGPPPDTQEDHERPGEYGRRAGRDECGPVVLQSEVGEPCRVVEAGESRPEPGDACGVPGRPELEDLGQELRDREGGSGDRGVVERVNQV